MRTLVTCSLTFATVLPIKPRCESFENPVGIDQAKPRLGWMLQSKDAGARQTAYQIEVTDTWDSGKIASDLSVAIPYGGPALESGKTYQWRVRVWDGTGEASPWSEVARWTMGKLQPGHWSARWIGAPDNPAPWFRGEFDLTGQPSSATVTVHSHAYYELYVNGVKAGDDVLTPAVADGKAQTFTVSYDVARLLKPGTNCLGLWMSKGWAERIAVRAQLDAVVDGRKVTFGTGPDWKTRPSGYRHIGRWNWGNFGGERVDASAHVAAAMGHGVNLGPSGLAGGPTLRANFNQRFDRARGLGRADLFPSRDFEPAQQPVDARRADARKLITDFLRAIQMPCPQWQHVFHAFPAWLAPWCPLL